MSLHKTADYGALRFTLLLLLQTLVFLALSGGLTLVAAGAAVYANQQRKAAAA